MFEVRKHKERLEGRFFSAEGGGREKVINSDVFNIYWLLNKTY